MSFLERCPQFGVGPYSTVFESVPTPSLPLGGFPYPSTTNEEVLEYLLQGKRLNQPPGCANEIYDIMMRCWERSPGERPSFSELQQRFAGMLLEEVDYMELSGLTEGLPPGTRVGQPAVARAVSTVLADQGRYDQLMVAPPTGNPYVLSPHPSSVPSPRNSSLLSERPQLDEQPTADTSTLQVQSNPSTNGRATLPARMDPSSVNDAQNRLSTHEVKFAGSNSSLTNIHSMQPSSSGVHAAIDARFSNPYV